MSGILGNAVPGAGGGAYTIDNSLRFRSSASAYLSRTPSTASGDTIWTFSSWVKRGTLGVRNTIIQAGTSATTGIRFTTSDTLEVYYYNGSSYVWQLITTQVFRDPSSWYHIVVAVDTTQATSSNRIKIYVNGSQVTAFGTTTYPSLNQGGYINYNAAHTISATSDILDGYLANVFMISGQALTASSFGETNASTGVWQPKAYTGTYGTNGFYLPFTNQSTATYAGSFNGSNQYLSVAQNAAFSLSTGNFTVEAWVYANSWNSVNPIIALGDGAVGGGSPVYSGWVMRYDNSSDGIIWYRNDTGGETSVKSGFQLSATKWNHIAITRSSGVLRFFANGVLVYSVANTTNYDAVNSDSLKIGGNWRIGGGVVTWLNGLISNARIVKGTALYTANFVPPTQPLTNVSGTSLLTLQNASIVDNSSNAFSITNNNSVSTSVQNPFAATGIAADQSGNANNWNTNNISLTSGVTYDSMTDSPTPKSATIGNFCVLNPLAKSSSITVSNANLTGVSSTTHQMLLSTMYAATGKYYAEITCNSAGTEDALGIATLSYQVSEGFYSVNKIGAFRSGGNVIYSTFGPVVFPTWTTNDVVRMSLDLDNQTFGIAINGGSFTTVNLSSYNSHYAGEFWTFHVFNGANAGSGSFNYSANFGQRPFVYTPPSGFNRLETYNLPTPTIGASSTTLANKYFDATTYTGNGSSQTVSNSGSMQPSFVWLKSRSNAYHHYLVDVLRGQNYYLRSSSTNGQNLNVALSFASTGFGLNSTSDTEAINANGATYIGWQWNSPSSGSSNTAGSITSTVSANTTSGFSIVTYTGNASVATVGHGLGATPKVVIVKQYNTSGNYFSMWFSGITSANQSLWMGSNSAILSTPNYWGGSTPTSTVYSVGNDSATNGSGSTYVAYCFAEKTGFSKFGSYTGNNSSDGPFIYCGFRPRFIMIKRTDAASDWFMYDTSRSTYNVGNQTLTANTTTAEGSYASTNYFDFLSNGFKIRQDNNSGYNNASGGTYIYMAFAENPFNYSLAR